jgi:hypothetical protein
LSIGAYVHIQLAWLVTVLSPSLSVVEGRKARTVELTPTIIAELRSHQLQRAQDMLKLRAPLSADDLVTAHADGSIVQAIYVSQHWARTILKSLAIRIFRKERLKFSNNQWSKRGGHDQN